MKFRSLAVVGTLLAATLIPVVGVTSASAHTPTASATCEALDVNATYYDGHKPAVGEPTIPNPAYVPAVPGVPAVGTPTITVNNPDYKPAVAEVPAVIVTEFEWRSWDWTHLKWDYRWSVTKPGYWWEQTGPSREHVVQEYVPAQPAVGTPTIEVANPDYKPEIPGKDAVGTPTIPNPAYVAGSDAPNTVVVTVDGDTVVSDSFGSSYSTSIPFANKYVAHDWSVKITAWNDPTGSKGWTKTYSGTTTPCDVPVVNPGYNANGEAVCGSAWVDLYNQQGEYEQALTASYVVYVDGEFSSAHAVAGGDVERVEFTFPEDSGNHQIIVRTGPAQGDEFVFSLDVTSDCIAPQPEDDVVTEQTVPLIPCDAEVGDEIDTTTTVTTTPYVLSENGWVPGEAVVTTEDSTYTVTAEDVANAEECPVVVTPPTETPKPAVVVKAAASDDDSTLAQTGGEIAGWAVGGGLLALIAGGLLVAARRRA